MQKALERKEELVNAKKEEEEYAKLRKKEAVIRAREKEKLFDQKNPEYKKQRDARMLAELQKALRAKDLDKVEYLVELYADEDIEDEQGVLIRAKTMLDCRKGNYITP